MSKFTPRFTKEYTFEGDKIKVVFCRLKRVHIESVSEFIDDDTGEISLKFKEVQQFMSAAAGILKDCVQKFSGLLTADGDEITEQSELFEQEVLNGMYFQDLLQEMVQDLISASMVSGDDEKKSPSSPPDTSAEQPPMEAAS